MLSLGEFFQDFLLPASWGFGFPPQREWRDVVSFNSPRLSTPLLPNSLNFKTHLCPNHSSFLHSSLLPSPFNTYSILFLTLLTPLPPANAYRQGHIQPPLRSCPASTSYRVLGREYLQSPQFQCSRKLLLCLTHAPRVRYQQQ